MENLNQGFKLRQKAENDLEKIYSYSSAEFGQERAESYVQTLIHAFEGLANGQKIARAYHHVNNNLWCYSCQSHLIFFKKTATTIDILRILHQSMDVSRHLQTTER